jgi:hypothetical protein
MSKYPSSFLRRIERQWVERIKSLTQLAERMLRHMFDTRGSLIAIPVKSMDRRRLDRSRSHD